MPTHCSAINAIICPIQRFEYIFVFDTTYKHNRYTINRQQQHNKEDNMMKGKEKMKKNKSKKRSDEWSRIMADHRRINGMKYENEDEEEHMDKRSQPQPHKGMEKRWVIILDFVLFDWCFTGRWYWLKGEKNKKLKRNWIVILDDA